MRTFFRFILAFIIISFVQQPAAHAKHRKSKKGADKIMGSYKPQNGLGGIAGKIMGDLKPVAGVTITVMQKDKIIDKVISDENGNYTFTFLTPDRYDLKGSKDGYRTTIIALTPVTADHTTKNDFYLPIYNNANMPRTPIVETYAQHMRHMKDK